MSAAQFSQAAVSKQRVALMIWPEFYLKAIPTLVGAWMLPVTLVGIICSLKKRRYRWDSVRVVLASVLTLSLLQCIWAKDARYLLWACPVATWFIAHAFFAAIRCELFSLNRSRVWTIAVVGLMGLAIYLTAINQQNPRKSVTGFSEVAEHMMKIAGGEPILYHGTYDGTFVFHTRSLDERFRQQVVLVRKLPMGMGQSVETNVLHWRRGKSRDELINEELLEKGILRTGCRWLLLEETSKYNQDQVASTILHLAKKNGYHLTKSFTVDMKTSAKQIDLYRIHTQEASQDTRPVPAVPMTIDGKNYLPVRPGGS